VGITSLLRTVLCVQDTVIEKVYWEDGALKVSVRPYSRNLNRCSRCRKRRLLHDVMSRRRHLRSIDLGSCKVYLVGDTHRVRCPEHGNVVAHVPWARRRSRFTLAFEDLACWLATHCSQSTVATYLRTTWRSIRHIIARRVMSSKWPAATADLRRIGIDEISYRKGQRYITVVVNHDSGRLAWVAPGRSKEVVASFFDTVGTERCSRIRLVTRDAASWISTVVEERCPQAVQCMDPFHVVQWATNAVDQTRRALFRTTYYWSHERKTRASKSARWILLRNKADLNPEQLTGLAEIQKENKPLYRAYLLKEQLRLVFRLPTAEAQRHLDRWLIWALRSKVPQFMALAKTISKHRDGIRACIEHGASNARVEAMNISLRLIARKAYGFHSAEAFIGLAMLKHSGVCPALPGRA